MKHKNDLNRQNFVRCRTKYNRIKSKAKQRHKISEGQKLNFEAKKQPRKFWRKIKSLRKSKTSKDQKVQLEDLVEHFQNMYSNDGDRLPTEIDGVPLNGNIFDPDLDSDICLEN